MMEEVREKSWRIEVYVKVEFAVAGGRLSRSICFNSPAHIERKSISRRKIAFAWYKLSM